MLNTFLSRFSKPYQMKQYVHNWKWDDVIRLEYQDMVFVWVAFSWQIIR